MVNPQMDTSIFHTRTFHKCSQVTVHMGSVRQTGTVEVIYGKESPSTEVQLLLCKSCTLLFKPGLVEEDCQTGIDIWIFVILCVFILLIWYIRHQAVVLFRFLKDPF